MNKLRYLLMVIALSGCAGLNAHASLMKAIMEQGSGKNLKWKKGC